MTTYEKLMVLRLYIETKNETGKISIENLKEEYSKYFSKILFQNTEIDYDCSRNNLIVFAKWMVR